jgi:hypothetical protein
LDSLGTVSLSVDGTSFARLELQLNFVNMENEPAPERSPSPKTDSTKEEDTTPQQSDKDVAAPLEPEKQRTALQTAVLMFALCVSFSSHLQAITLVLTIPSVVCLPRRPRCHDRYHRPTNDILILQNFNRLYMGRVGIHVGQRGLYAYMGESERHLGA